METKKDKLFIRTNGKDVFETFSYLLKLLKDRNIGRKRRNFISKEFLKIVHYRGVSSRIQVFNDLKDVFEEITGLKLIVRK